MVEKGCQWVKSRNRRTLFPRGPVSRFLTALRKQRGLSVQTMSRRNEHPQLVSRNERTRDPFRGVQHEPDINDAAPNPLAHFLRRAFKEHHVHVRILLMKTGQHTGEQTWAEGENTAQSKFPHCQTMRSIFFSSLGLTSSQAHGRLATPSILCVCRSGSVILMGVGNNEALLGITQTRARAYAQSTSSCADLVHGSHLI